MRTVQSGLRLAFAAVAATSVLAAQGAVLDVLDGETLYDGGFLWTVGQEIQRRETLRQGTGSAADPLQSHELEQATTTALQWGLRHDLQLGIATQFVHNEQVRGGTQSELDAFGDVELMAKWRFLRQDGRGFATNYALLGGVSLPTGEDDETRDGNELSPDVQTGSGGIDPMLGAAVTHEPGRWRFNAAATWQWRTDSDGDGDHVGDEKTIEIAVGNRFWLEPYPGPFMRLDVVARYYHLGRDHFDHALQDGTGSERLTAGLNLAFRPRPSLDFQVYVEVPVLQQVEGTQLGVDWQADFTFGHRF